MLVVYNVYNNQFDYKSEMTVTNCALDKLPRFYAADSEDGTSSDDDDSEMESGEEVMEDVTRKEANISGVSDMDVSMTGVIARSEMPDTV